MSDYSQHNQGLGGKGIIVGFLLVALFVVGLVFLGSGGSDVEPGTAVIDSGSAAQAPAVAD